MSKVINKTIALQTDLALYCRTGIKAPKTTIKENTFHYRRLVFNIIKDTLKTAYPLTRELIGKKRWKKSVDYFFEKHSCQTPQVWRLPFEFYEFYVKNSFPFKKKFPHIYELLLFEWLEIDVFMMEDCIILPFKKEGNLYEDILVSNPEIKVLPLTFPVHNKKTKTITKADKGNYFVTIHRDFYDKNVRFNDLSYPFVEMLLKINDEETTFNDLLKIYTNYEADTVIAKQTVETFLEFALVNNLILGYKKQ